ncbi:MAG: hypothetical protein H6807_08880 [Planctomycetes bacterium]|nr:hypothetical protein [Planctomycetota bacterium]
MPIHQSMPRAPGTWPLRGRLLAALAFLVLVGPAPAQIEERREEYPDGSTAKIYHVDGDGEPHGSWVEFFPSGKIRLRAQYRHGQLDGAYESYREDGKRLSERRYLKGEVQKLCRYDADSRPIHVLERSRGELVLKLKGAPDVVLFPRSLAAIRRDLTRIDGAPVLDSTRPYEEEPSLTAPFAAGRPRPDLVAEGRRRAEAYRYLCGLPHELAVDASLTNLAQHAALICCLIGELSHTPPQPPGMPAALYAIARQGAAESNLHQGRSSIRQSVDGYMDDSDDRNFRHVGHRRWILSPRMTRTGFGIVSGFCAMNVQDTSGRGLGPLSLAFPPPGYLPVDYFAGPHLAWHFSWDRSRVRIANGERPRAVLTLLDESYDIVGPIEVEQINVDDEAIGDMPALVFRPKFDAGQCRPGLRVLVEIKGIVMPKKERPIYLVELVEAQNPTTARK